MVLLQLIFFIVFVSQAQSYNQDCSSYIHKNNWFGFVFCITQRCPDPNAEFVDCGVTCSQTCEYNRNQPIGECLVINGRSGYGNHQCVQRCMCKPGHVKQSEKFNAPCVPANQCPRQCSDPNAYYAECGSRCVEVCGASSTPSENCSPACTAGCFCKTGYIKESGAHNARCIPKSTCSVIQNLPPPTFRLCPDPNAEYSMCGSECSAVCRKPTPKYCSMRCVEGCFCRPGYVKLTNAPDSPCITNDQCSTMTTSGGSTNLIPSMPNLCMDSNARYLFWGPLCWPTCDGVVCSGACRPQPNCFCKDGYVKSSATDSAICVLIDQCRRHNFISGCMNNNQGQSCSNSCSQFCQASGPSSLSPSNDCLSTNVQMCQCISSFNRQSAHCLFPCPRTSQNPMVVPDDHNQIEFCDCAKCSRRYAMVNPYCAARCKCFLANVPHENNIDHQQHCNCYDCASENSRMTPYCFTICGCRTMPLAGIKPGQCPGLGPNPGTSQRKDQCKQDSDCQGSAKCCDTWAGLTCLLP